jgi:UDP-glucose pyrophosphorylase
MGKKSKRRTKTTTTSSSSNQKPEAVSPSANPATTTISSSQVASIEKEDVKLVTPTPKNTPVSKVTPNDTSAVVTSLTSPTSVSPEEMPALVLPESLEASLQKLTPSQQSLVKALCSSPTNQAHIFSTWSDSSTTDASKKSLVEQLERIDKAYPTGLVGYIKNARDLLEKSRKGVNPLEGWKPEVPQGESFDIGTKEFDDFEGVGLQEMGKCGFVLVAGGLGERLGYSGIKVRNCILNHHELSYVMYTHMV